MSKPAIRPSVKFSKRRFSVVEEITTRKPILKSSRRGVQYVNRIQHARVVRANIDRQDRGKDDEEATHSGYAADHSPREYTATAELPSDESPSKCRKTVCARGFQNDSAPDTIQTFRHRAIITGSSCSIALHISILCLI